jgi:hypothetical protein
MNFPVCPSWAIGPDFQAIARLLIGRMVGGSLSQVKPVLMNYQVLGVRGRAEFGSAG